MNKIDLNRREEIRSKFPDKIRFNELDFWSVCPYSIDELKEKKRKRIIVAWRNIGMLWSYMSGKTWEDSANNFAHHHTTAIHGVKEILLSIEGYGIEDHRLILQKIYNHVDNYVEPSDEFFENEMISLVQLDSLYADLIASKNGLELSKY